MQLKIPKLTIANLAIGISTDIAAPLSLAIQFAEEETVIQFFELSN